MKPIERNEFAQLPAKQRKAQLLAILQTMKNESSDMQSLIDDIVSGKRDAAHIKMSARIQLKKFNGQKNPGDEPVEVLDFITEL